MKTRVTKVFRFEMAHQLDTCYSKECKQIHGHSYKLEATFENGVNEDGMVIDFKKMKEVIQPLVDRFDHTFITKDSFGENPTAENMAQFFFQGIREEILCIHKVRLWETDTCYAEVLY